YANANEHHVDASNESASDKSHSLEIIDTVTPHTEVRPSIERGSRCSVVVTHDPKVSGKTTEDVGSKSVNGGEIAFQHFSPTSVSNLLRSTRSIASPTRTETTNSLTCDGPLRPNKHETDRKRTRL